MNCLNCLNNTANPSFCSRSCAVSYNNKKKKKRQLKTIGCKYCQEIIPRIHCKQRSIICCKCKDKNKYGKDPTIEEVTYKHLHKSSAFAFIRGRARRSFKDITPKCTICGYDKHVEIAHKAAISSFPVTARLSIVNHLENLIPLCPNCHWEFDHTDSKCISIDKNANDTL